MRTAAQWTGILTLAGCSAATAATWGPVCEETVLLASFSKGEADVLDFVPTILHESAMLAKLKESGKYSAARIRELGNASAAGSRWRSLVARADELAYDGTPASEDRFFEACYAGRMGNGPEGSGDGAKYPGRGTIGVTGLYGYQWLTDNGKLDNNDLVSVPTLLEQPRYAMLNGIDWWEGHVPDAALGDDRRIRKIVNGGYFGVEEVEALAARFRKAWKA
jgi:putative chitinase